MYPIDIHFELNGEDRIAHARSRIGFDEMLVALHSAHKTLNTLGDDNIWATVFFLKMSTIMQYFSDVNESNPGLDMSELVYGSNFYAALLEVADAQMVHDIQFVIEQSANEVARKSSLDRLVDKAIGTLSHIDEVLSNEIDIKGVGKLISKLNTIKLSEKAIINAIASFVHKGAESDG